MKAVILVGGFGTRLRPLSCTRPKSLFPIVNKPLLQWTFERLAKNNIRDVILATNYITEAMIKQYRIPKQGIHVTYSRDPPRKPLGTGGPIKKAEKLVGHDSMFLVLNGDIFAELNYRELLKAHEDKAAVATIALCKVKDPSRYGVAELASDMRIRKFVEKPPPGTASTNLINAGVYAFSPKIFEYIPKGRTVSMEREVFPNLADENKLFGFVHNGLWTDIGTSKDYLEINKILLNSKIRAKRPKFGKEVEIKMPVAIGRKVIIEEKSVIGPHTVLGERVRIGRNVNIQDSLILSDSIISDFTTIKNAIIGEGTFIGAKVKIEKGCVVGDHAKIRDNVALSEGAWVCPAKEISESVPTPRNTV